MTYTQITMTPEKTSTREISELKFIELLAQIIALIKAGEDIEFTRVYSDDFRHLYRYEMVRNIKGRTVTTHFIPSDTEAAWAD